MTPEEQKVKAIYLKTLASHPKFNEHVFEPMVRLSRENQAALTAFESTDEKIRFAQGVVYAVQYLSNLFAMSEQMLETEKRKANNERLSKQD